MWEQVKVRVAGREGAPGRGISDQAPSLGWWPLDQFSMPADFGPG